jgi:hypothetical protein
MFQLFTIYIALTMLSFAVLSTVREQQSAKYFWGSEHHLLYKLEIKEQTQTVNAIKRQFRFPTFHSKLLPQLYTTPTPNPVLPNSQLIYSTTLLIRIHWDGMPSGYAENTNQWIFLCK